MRLFNIIVWLEVQPEDNMLVNVLSYDVAPNVKRVEIFVVKEELETLLSNKDECDSIERILQGVTTIKPEIMFNDDHLSVWGTNKELMIDTLLDWFDEHQQFLRVVDSKMINNELLKLKG